jgi:cobalt-zinc-cadmium efflux system protein
METLVPAGRGAPASFKPDIVARSADSRRLLIALGLSLAVLTIEVAGGFLTGSLALLSDATHVGVDVIALLVGIGAARLAAREPNDSHTYGYQRLEAIGALANAVLLLAASSAVLVESVGRLVGPTPGPIDAPAVLAVACIGLVANGASALIVNRGARRTDATRILVLHLGGDALGALAVIVAAIVMMAGGPTSADAVASLAIAALLAFAGFRLLGQIIHLLAEGVPTSVPVAFASAALHAVPGVVAVHDLHVWALAEDMPVVTAHLELASATDARRVLLTATEALRRIGVDHATLQLEGDPCGQGRAAAADPGGSAVTEGARRPADRRPS